MKPSHTPGLWTVDWSDDGPLIYTGDLLIASVSGSTEHIKVQGLDEKTTKANASLMAAAPDLLEALEHMLEFGERWNAEVIKQARAAIAKAKG